MKKQILSLIFYTASFAFTSGFCMNFEDEKLEKELVVQMLNNLKPVDILSVKRTSKYFYNLVKENKRIFSLGVSYGFDKNNEIFNISYYDDDLHNHAYQRIKFSLFCENGGLSSLINLGEFDIPVESTKKSLICLPASVKEATFLAKWHSPYPLYHDRNHNSSTTWGQDFDRFIPESHKSVNGIPIKYWGDPYYEKIYSKTEKLEPQLSKILDGSKFILRIIGTESFGDQCHIVGPSSLKLDYLINPDNG